MNNNTKREIEKDLGLNRTIEKAYGIAKNALRMCYGRHGIKAGRHQFEAYWARDQFFASFGALRIKDCAQVKKGLHLMMEFQKEDGQIPLRVSHYALALRYIGVKIKKALGAKYRPDLSFGAPLDQNSLFIILFCTYIKQTGDYKFARKYLETVRKALIWNIKVGGELLLKEKGYANWADSIRKDGYVLYTNVCHYKALKDFAELQKRLNDKRFAETCKNRDLLKTEINRKFWNGRYYVDWISEHKVHDYFATDGNLLATLWGIADKKKAKSILNFLHDHHLHEPVPTRTNYPCYNIRKTPLLLRIIGLANYHNSTVAWLWLGCIDSIVRYKYISKEKAKRELYHIADTIVQFNGVYEVYDMFGQPLKTWYYMAEHPFAWSAGLFVEAYHAIYKRKKSILF